jgi:class 3 adenylate cyclase
VASGQLSLGRAGARLDHRISGHGDLFSDHLQRVLSAVLRLRGRYNALLDAMNDSNARQTETATLASLIEQLKVSEKCRLEAQSFQRATSEILQVIRDSPSDVQPVFDIIVKRAVELCGAAFGYVLRYDGEILSLAAHHVPNAEGLRVLETTFPMRANKQAYTSRAVLERRVVHIHDVLTEPNYAYAQLQQALGYRTFVVVPIFRQESPIGAIAVYRQEVAPFSDAEIALVETFASQAVIAIENARMFSELQAKSHQVEEQAAQLAEWNKTLETRVSEQVAQIGRMSKLTRFLSPKISELIMSGEADDPLKSRRAEVTVVYVDLRGFTAFTETADPEEVMTVLREYHAELGRAITAYDGTIEHFAGDGAMIIFNAPLPVENHELQAILMTIQIRDAVAALTEDWKKRGYTLGFGAGIAGGYATIGTIGFEDRLDYGAIGTVCNLAARLCGEASDGQILISPRVFAKIEKKVEASPVGELSLKGFHRPIAAHNVIGLCTTN